MFKFKLMIKIPHRTIHSFDDDCS